MLELIKNWVVTITVAVLTGAILETMLPQGSIKKYAKTAIALCLILVIIAPVIGLLTGDANVSKDMESIFTGNGETTIQAENNLSLYKDYVYEVYMRNKKNKNE